MSAQSRSSDTSPEAERVQIDLLRSAPISRRIQLAWSLSAWTIDAARRAIARRYPQAPAHEIGLKFVELHYGRDLAGAVRAELARRHDPTPIVP